MKDLTHINIDQFGHGKKKLAIFAPISPQWNGSKDIQTKFERYTQTYSIFYVDTLSIVWNCKSLADAVNLFKEYIKKYFVDAEALIGIAFGGTLLQHISDILSRKYRLGLISSPTYANTDLVIKLETVISLLLSDKLLEAINLIECFVQPSIKTITTNLINLNSITNIAHAKERMLHGYNLMLQADARDMVKNIPTTAMALLGEYSQLATLKNVLLPKNQIKVIPGAGMRALDSTSKYLHSVLDQLLLGELHDDKN